MIQRIQSLYLLLSTIISAALFYIPLFKLPVSNAETFKHFFIQDSSFLMILNIAIGLLSFFSIFLFKNRKLQIRTCRLCLMLVFVLIGLLFFTSDTLTKGTDTKVDFMAGVYFPLVQVVVVFLAQRAIAKDEELVRSADRLR